MSTMNKTTLLLLSCPMVCLGISCSSPYQMTGVERTRILVDEKYDQYTDAAVEAFIAPYRQQVDSMMSPVVGHSAAYMNATRPEGTLSNLLADILVWSGQFYDEQPDFAVYNMGGIRSALGKGEVTKGDVVDIAPFENKVCFVTLSGTHVLQLFREIASTGGEALSHGVELQITPEGQLLEAKLFGNSIQPDKHYRVATIDYVALGKDHMEAFKLSTDSNMPKAETNNVRYIIMKYLQEMASKGVAVNAAIEGRIKIVQP